MYLLVGIDQVGKVKGISCSKKKKKAKNSPEAQKSLCHCRPARNLNWLQHPVPGNDGRERGCQVDWIRWALIKFGVYYPINGNHRGFRGRERHDQIFVLGRESYWQSPICSTASVGIPWVSTPVGDTAPDSCICFTPGRASAVGPWPLS